MTRTIAVRELRQKLREAYRKLDDPLFDKCMNELPAIPPQAFCYFMDGNKWCCVRGDFRNLHEDCVGFGDTERQAYDSLVADIKRELESRNAIEDKIAASGVNTIRSTMSFGAAMSRHQRLSDNRQP